MGPVVASASSNFDADRFPLLDTHLVCHCQETANAQSTNYGTQRRELGYFSHLKFLRRVSFTEKFQQVKRHIFQSIRNPHKGQTRKREERKRDASYLLVDKGPWPNLRAVVVARASSKGLIGVGKGTVPSPAKHLARQAHGYW